MLVEKLHERAVVWGGVSTESEPLLAKSNLGVLHFIPL